LFSYVDLEKRIRPDHPLRTIRRLVDDALASLDRTFADLYAAFGRPSIPPERLLRAMLLQAFYSIRSERLLMERLDYDLLFRWFVGLGIDDPVWDPSTFSKNRDRLLEGDIAARFLTAVLALPRVKRLLSSEHFSVDGTLIEAWASMKSVKPKDSPDPDEKDPPQGRNPEVNFRGERRSNETHASTTDPEARLYRKGAGKEAKLCFMGHALMENRNGLIVDACVTQADGHAERIAALAMIEPWADRPNRITLGADKAFDTQDFVNELRAMNVTPHVAQNTAGRRSAIDGRVTRHQGYALSQKLRKRIEEAFGWAKEISGLGRTRFRGRERVGQRELRSLVSRPRGVLLPRRRHRRPALGEEFQRERRITFDLLLLKASQPGLELILEVAEPDLFLPKRQVNPGLGREDQHRDQDRDVKGDLEVEEQQVRQDQPGEVGDVERLAREVGRDSVLVGPGQQARPEQQDHQQHDRLVNADVSPGGRRLE